MDTLKTKLPDLEFSQSDYIVKSTTQKVEEKKEKYLDDILSKEFLKKYFSDSSKSFSRSKSFSKSKSKSKTLSK